MENKEIAIARLYEVLAGISDAKDCALFLEDLCTHKEIEQMAQRVKAAELLLDNKTYAQVIAETDISSATLSRVSRCIRYGDGGYRRVLKKDGNE